jgi:ABC-type enterobactin transport system permease subunit
MSNSESQSSGLLRKFGLPLLALAVSAFSPLAGAVIGAIALKQFANRQSDPSKKKMALIGIVVLAALAAIYTAVSFVLLSTGFDPSP